MKVIYLTKFDVSQKIVSGDMSDNTAVYADYTRTDIDIRKVGVEYEKDTETLRIVWIGLMINPESDEYISMFKRQIKTMGGNFVDAGNPFQRSATANFYRYNNPAHANFGHIDYEPLDEEGNLKAGLVNEIEFFSYNIGRAANNVPMGLFDVFVDSIVSQINKEA